MNNKLPVYLLLFLFAKTVICAYDYCPNSDKTPDKIAIDNHDDGTPYIDYNRELKDFGTDFIVNEFFRTPDKLFNFINLVYGSLNQAVENYKNNNKIKDPESVSLLFKGGNVMRMVANGVFKMLPPEAKELLEGEYAKHFKRSDADFGVMVNPKGLPENFDYERAMDNLSKISFRTLNMIRNELNKNPEKYFNKSQFSSAKMADYFAKLEQLDSTKNKDNPNWYQAKFLQLQLLGYKANQDLKCNYEGQYDYKYLFDRTAEANSRIIGIPLNKKTNWIMNTINKTLEIPSETDPKKIVKFYLVRSKAQFEYTFTKNNQSKRIPIGGELIDVSFSHKDDARTEPFFINYKRGVADYILSMGDKSIKIKAESLFGLAKDLYEVVFEQWPRPWAAKKYEKRVSRIFFLSIVEMMGKLGIGSNQAKDYIEQVKADILAPLASVYPLSESDPDQATKLVEQTLTRAKELHSSWPDMEIAGQAFIGLSELASHMFENPWLDDKANFENLLKLIEDNLEFMSKLTEMSPNKIDLQQIYNVDISSLF